MTVLGLDHVSVSVANLDRSLAFYRDLLGIHVHGTGAEESPSVAGGRGSRAFGFRPGAPECTCPASASRSASPAW